MKHIYEISSIFENNEDILYIFSRDDNNIKYVERKKGFKPYFFIPKNEFNDKLNIESDNKIYYSAFNEELIKLIFNNTKNLQNSIKKFTKTYEADLKLENRFIIDNENILKKKGYDFNAENAREICIDIETTISNKFPDVFNPIESITMITCYDSYENNYKTFFWTKNSIILQEKNIFIFDNEIDMLNNFLNYISRISPDIISGFNVIDFDLSYIIARCEKLNLNYLKLSPVNKIYKYIAKYKDKNYFNFKIIGISFIDIQHWYKQLRHGDISSYSLKNIAREELNETQELINTNFEWENNIEKFIKYNITDVKLTLMLSKKYEIKRFLNNLRILSHLNYVDLWSYGRIVDILMLNIAKQKEIILPSKIKSSEKEGIVGAYVYAKSGLYNNVIALDYSSLYPTIITTFNLSKEQRDINGEIDINNIKISNKNIGLMPLVVNNLMDLRKEYDNERKKYIYGSLEYEKYNSLLHSVKNVHSTCYGTQAYSGFRLFDREIAETITKTGQELIQKSKALAETFGHEVVYIDTDSIYIKLNNINDLNKIIIEGRNLVNEINNMAKLWCISKGVKSGGTFNIKFEKVYSKLLVSAKKRYAGKIIWKDDKEEDSLHITGMAFKRSDNSKFSRDLQKKALNILLSSDGSYEKMVEYLDSEYNKIINNHYDFSYIGFPNKINKLSNEYHTTLPKLRALEWAKQNINKEYTIGSKILIIPIKNNKFDFMAFEYEEDIVNIKNNIELNYGEILRRGIYLVMVTIFEVLHKENDLTELHNKYLTILNIPIKKPKQPKQQVIEIEVKPLNIPDNFKINKSSYNLFNSCQRQFYYSYAKYPKEQNELTKEIMQYGIDFHNLMKLFNENKLINVPDKFKELLITHKSIVITELEPKGYNKPLLIEGKLIHQNINGIIDIALTNGNKNLIIDYKTVLNLKDNFSKYKPELLIYAYLLNKNLSIPYNQIELGIEMIEQNTGLVNFKLIPFKEKDVEKEIENVKNTYEFIKTHNNINDYLKVSKTKSSKICKYCDYYKICK